MYLLNVETRKLEYFTDHRQVTGQYAILSHTWGNEEVTFEELHSPKYKTRESYKKIKYLCRQAVMDGLQYAWVDTCCIDKKSSAELSEAINSMSGNTFLDFSYPDEGSASVKRSDKLLLCPSPTVRRVYSLEIEAHSGSYTPRVFALHTGQNFEYSAVLRSLEVEEDDDEIDVKPSLSSDLVLEEGKWDILQRGGMKLHVKLHLGSNAGSMMWCLSISASPPDEES